MQHDDGYIYPFKSRTQSHNAIALAKYRDRSSIDNRPRFLIDFQKIESSTPWLPDVFALASKTIVSSNTSQHSYHLTNLFRLVLPDFDRRRCSSRTRRSRSDEPDIAGRFGESRNHRSGRPRILGRELRCERGVRCNLRSDGRRGGVVGQRRERRSRRSAARISVCRSKTDGTQSARAARSASKRLERGDLRARARATVDDNGPDHRRFVCTSSASPAHTDGGEPGRSRIVGIVGLHPPN